MRPTDPELNARAELALARLAMSLKLAFSERAVLWAIANEAIGALKLEDCVVYARRGARLEQIAAFGLKQAAPYLLESRITLALGQGIVGHCARDGLAIRLDDVRTDPRYVIDDQPRASELAVPILDPETSAVLGVIDSEHSETGFFGDAHQRVLEQIAALGAVRLKELLA
jgi:GAF domain-containing protein